MNFFLLQNKETINQETFQIQFVGTFGYGKMQLFCRPLMLSANSLIPLIGRKVSFVEIIHFKRFLTYLSEC